MLTPQEITDKIFVKAVFGGYDMTGVDDFLEAISADYTALYKENAILKGKLKVLVEKVEEYRSTEDSMRMALLTAQRMGEEIKSEANKQREETLRNMELETKSRLADTARRIADEELRLRAAAKETGKFIEISQAILRKHMEFLTKLETARRGVKPGTEDAQAQPPAKAHTQDSAPPKSYAQDSSAPKSYAQGSSASKSYAQDSSSSKSYAQDSSSSKSYAQDSSAPKSYAQDSSAPRSYAQDSAPVKVYTPKPPSREEQLAEAAEMIGDVMGQLSGSDLPAPEYAPDYDPPPQMSVRALEDVDEDEFITPRPKFDFEDLKFGSNFNLDD